MINVLNNLRPLIQNSDSKKTWSEISNEYRESSSPTLFATAYSRIYLFAIKQSNKYYGFEDTDLSSFCLESLDISLKLYSADKGCFTTYFGVVFNNTLRTAIQKKNTDKRKANFQARSYELMLEDGFDIPTEVDYTLETIEYLESLNLSERELTYCKLILSNHSNKQIAEKLDVSKMTVTNISKRLRKKVEYSALII